MASEQVRTFAVSIPVGTKVRSSSVEDVHKGIIKEFWTNPGLQIWQGNGRRLLAEWYETRNQSGHPLLS